MLEATLQAHFLKEAFRVDGAMQLPPQHLHRHVPPVLQVTSQKDNSHPTTADLPDDLEAVTKSLLHLNPFHCHMTSRRGRG